MHVLEQQKGFESLAAPVVVTRDQKVVYVNPCWEALFGLDREQQVGKATSDVIRGTIVEADVTFTQTLGDRLHRSGDVVKEFWVRITTPAGERLVKVRSSAGPGEAEQTYLLLEADDEADNRGFTVGLISGTGRLLACHTDAEVLDAALDVLAELGMYCAVLFVRGQLLHRGPGRQDPIVRQQIEAAGPASKVTTLPLEHLPHVSEVFKNRRGIFHQDVYPACEKVLPPAVMAIMRARFPALRGLDMPVFVHDQPFALLTVQSATLTPAKAATLELFGRQVGTALENLALQRELIARERLAVLGEAAAVLAHEVRHPVGVIANTAALLRREGRSGAVPELVRVLEEESLRLDELVNALLDFSRPIEPLEVAVPLYELFSSTVSAAQRRYEAAGVQVMLSMEEATLRSNTDPRLLQIAVKNLLHNAVQASPPGGRVVLDVVSRDKIVCIGVIDQGPGIPPDDLSRIFEPFFTTRAKGTGLGLSVVKRMVEALGATVTVDSSSGQGTRFELRLR